MMENKKEFLPSDLPKTGEPIHIVMPALGEFPEQNAVLKYDQKNFHFDIYIGDKKVSSIGEKNVLNNLNNGQYIIMNHHAKGGKLKPSYHRLRWEVHTIKYLEDIGKMTTSDAQSLVETTKGEKAMDEAFEKNMEPEAAAKFIWEKTGEDYHAKGGQAETTKNKWGNDTLEFKGISDVSKYKNRHGLFPSGPLTGGYLRDRNGLTYLWSNRKQWESSSAGEEVPIIFKKESKTGFAKGGAMKKYKIGDTGQYRGGEVKILGYDDIGNVEVVYIDQAGNREGEPFKVSKESFSMAKFESMPHDEEKKLMEDKAKEYFDKAREMYHKGDYKNQDRYLEGAREFEMHALGMDKKKFNKVFGDPDVQILTVGGPYRPLSSQIEFITGDSLNANDYEGDWNFGHVFTHKKTGKKFTVINADQVPLWDKYVMKNKTKRYDEGGMLDVDFTEDVKEAKKLAKLFYDEYKNVFGLDEQFVESIKPQLYLGYGASNFLGTSVKSDIEKLKVGETRPESMTIAIQSDINPNGIMSKDDIGRTYVIDFTIHGQKRYTLRTTQDGFFSKYYVYDRTAEGVMKKFDDFYLYELKPEIDKNKLKFTNPNYFAEGGETEAGKKIIIVTPDVLENLRPYQGTNKMPVVGDELEVYGKRHPMVNKNEYFYGVTDWIPNDNTLRLIARKDDPEADKYGWKFGAEVLEERIKEKEAGDVTPFNRWSLAEKYVKKSLKKGKFSEGGSLNNLFDSEQAALIEVISKLQSESDKGAVINAQQRDGFIRLFNDGISIMNELNPNGEKPKFAEGGMASDEECRKAVLKLLGVLYNVEGHLAYSVLKNKDHAEKALLQLVKEKIKEVEDSGFKEVPDKFQQMTFEALRNRGKFAEGGEVRKYGKFAVYQRWRTRDEIYMSRDLEGNPLMTQEDAEKMKAYLEEHVPPKNNLNLVVKPIEKFAEGGETDVDNEKDRIGIKLAVPKEGYFIGLLYASTSQISHDMKDVPDTAENSIFRNVSREFDTAHEVTEFIKNEISSIDGWKPIDGDESFRAIGDSILEYSQFVSPRGAVGPGDQIYDAFMSGDSSHLWRKTYWIGVTEFSKTEIPKLKLEDLFGGKQFAGGGEMTGEIEKVIARFKDGIKSRGDVELFFAMLDIDLELNWHPDNNFSDYVHFDSNKKVFTKDEAAQLDKIMEQCFEYCDTHGLDIYEIGLEQMKKDGLNPIEVAEDAYAKGGDLSSANYTRLNKYLSFKKEGKTDEQIAAIIKHDFRNHRINAYTLYMAVWGDDDIISSVDISKKVFSDLGFASGSGYPLKTKDGETVYAKGGIFSAKAKKIDEKMDEFVKNNKEYLEVQKSIDELEVQREKLEERFAKAVKDGEDVNSINDEFRAIRAEYMLRSNAAIEILSKEYSRLKSEVGAHLAKGGSTETPMWLKTKSEVLKENEAGQARLTKEFNALLKTFKAGDQQFFFIDVDDFDGKRMVYDPGEKEFGLMTYMGTYRPDSVLTFMPIGAEREKGLYEAVKKGGVQVTRVPKSAYRDVYPEQVLIKANPRYFVGKDLDRVYSHAVKMAVDYDQYQEDIKDGAITLDKAKRIILSEGFDIPEHLGEKFADGGSTEDKILPEAYYKKFRIPGNYRREYSIFSPGMYDRNLRRAARILFPAMTTAEHKELAKKYNDLAEKKNTEYGAAVDDAFMKKFGRKPGWGDYKISGIYSDEIAEDDKDKISKILGELQAYRDVYYLHNAMLNKPDKVEKKFAKGGTIEKDTALLPWLIAETVAEDKISEHLKLPFNEERAKKSKELATWLEERAERLYKKSDHFTKLITSKRGNEGRDNMYMFMGHWADAYLKTPGFAEREKKLIEKDEKRKASTKKETKKRRSQLAENLKNLNQ